MNTALITTVLSALATIIQDTPEAVQLFNTARQVLTQGSDPTPEQWQALLTNMVAVHAKVQAG